jgi:hypothetical protein
MGDRRLLLGAVVRTPPVPLPLYLTQFLHSDQKSAGSLLVTRLIVQALRRLPAGMVMDVR